MFKKFIRGLGRRLVSFGCEIDDPKKVVDFRWTDPQNKIEAVNFLARRIEFSAEKTKAVKIVLIGEDITFGLKVEQLINGNFVILKFKTVDDFIQNSKEEKEDYVVGITSLIASEIHFIALELIDHEITNSIPFEYVVIPKLENQIIDRMWEDSRDFISPIHIQTKVWENIFQQSCEVFDPKTGIRDYMDLVQGLNHINARNLSGDIAEFGSFRGQSGYLTAKYLKEVKSIKKLFMFDMFESFPVETIGVDQFWSETHEVNFADIKRKFKDLPNVELVKGDFTKTFEGSNCKELALAFVDCDSYRGTKYLIETIFDHFLVAGGIMVFEDYGHASLLGNRIAVHQFFDNKENAFCFFSHFSGSYFVCKIK
jgi:hypothetical protein